jgi:carbon storage regulator CsrA
MLVLSRKYQEKIRIGNGITITILRAKGKAVRLGIEAPPDVPVIRGELAFDALRHNGDNPEVASNGSEAREFSTRATANHRQAPQRDLPNGQVALHRVPRGRAAEILPKLMPAQAPLRAMLNQRAAAL